MKKLVILISGNGSNLQAIINEIYHKRLDCVISAVVSNRKNAYGLTRARDNDIPIYYLPYIRNKIDRKDYDKNLKNLVDSFNPDIIVCAGWMHVLSSEFIDYFNKLHILIINLHPALPNMIPGKNSIEDAITLYHQNKISHTGIMVHHVIPEIDAGSVINTQTVKIYKNDSINDLKSRIQYFEKQALIKGIKIVMSNYQLVKQGKVRDIYQDENNLDTLVFLHSDRLSSFDKHICMVNGKGNILCKTTAWWFNQTSHIIPNHMITAKDNYILAKACEVIPIEFVVRGYITGSTSTSLWTHYNKGVRNYCGIDFPEGLVKNQKLSVPVLTPTTKDEHDEPLSCQDIVTRGVLSQEDLDYISGKAMELFNYGSKLALEKGLILVDTKYEFGRDKTGRIILIDEVHTCDSSRYWKLSSYQERFTSGQEPEKLDKDSCRDYVKSVCDPYNEAIPEIPDDRKARVYQCYLELHNTLTNEGYEGNTNPVSDSLNHNLVMDLVQSNQARNMVVILSGSPSDAAHIDKITSELDKQHLNYQAFICSAHKYTQKLLNILGDLEKSNYRLVYVTVAGRSNALSGVVACNTRHPVIACPPFKDKLDMLVNVHSSLQCPSKVPVMTILEPNNVAISISRIFNL